MNASPGGRPIAMFGILLLALGCSSEPPQPPQPPPKESSSGSPVVTETAVAPTEASAQGEVSLTRNFYFIFDGSSSMNDKCKGASDRFRNKIEGARWAVQEFMRKVPDDVNLGLYIFDRKGRREAVRLGPSTRQTFLDAIGGVDAWYGTPLAESMRFGVDRLVEQYGKQLGYGEFRLIVVTDGLADGLAEAAQYATRKGIPIYAIGLCIDADHPLRRYALSYREANSYEDLAKGLEETLSETEAFDSSAFEALKATR